MKNLVGFSLIAAGLNVSRVIRRLQHGRRSEYSGLIIKQSKLSSSIINVEARAVARPLN